MVTTAADPSSSHHNLTASADTVSVTNNPTIPRNSMPSPWARVVRGADTDPHSTPSPSLSSSAAGQQAPSFDPSPHVENSNSDASAAAAAAVDNSDADRVNNNNAGVRPMKPAWKRPSNGVADSGAAVNVMGAVSWPALSESTKLSAKSTPQSSSNKTASDGSLPTPQGHVSSQSPQKQAAITAKPNAGHNVKPNPGHGVANRQSTMKRAGGNGNSIGHGHGHGHGHAQSSFSAPPPPPPPPFPMFQISPSNFANGVPGVPDPSPRNPYRNNNWGPRPPFGGFMPPMIEQRNPSRRGNFGNHPRGDGSYHSNYGNRRDQDRGNYPHARDAQDRRNYPQARDAQDRRNYSHARDAQDRRSYPHARDAQDRGNYPHARDAHLHSPRPYPGPPPPNAPPTPIVGPQPMLPLPHPAGFPEYRYFPTSQFEPFGGRPFFTHGPNPAMFFPVAKTPLTDTIVNQIDYYFSDANLVKDEYLRSKMDEHGWVPVTLIASFPRIKSLTSSVEVILDSMRTSMVVEVQGNKLRRHGEWMKWLPAAPRRADYGSTNPGGSSSNNLTADFEKITLNEATADRVNPDPTTNGDGCVTGESIGLPNGDAGNSN